MGALMMIILIFGLPVAATAGWLIYGIRRRVLRAKNKETPGTYPDEKLEDSRINGKACGIVALITWLLLLGVFLMLRFGAISFM